MAKTSLKVKAARKPKFKVRGYTRCQRCGRPHSVYQKFGICRVCFREMAHRGELPGITKGLLGNTSLKNKEFKSYPITTTNKVCRKKPVRERPRGHV